VSLKPGPDVDAREVQWSLLLVIALLGVLGVIITWFTAPLERLLGESAYALEAAIHGVLAGVLMVAVTIGLFQAARLFSGHPPGIRELHVGSAVTAMLTLLTIIAGNRIYIPYRASGGPRTYFLEHAPEVHKIFFEFKEFMALFALPLAVCAAYLLWRYGEAAMQRRDLRTTIAALLLLLWFYFLVAFGLGAAITKLKPV